MSAAHFQPQRPSSPVPIILSTDVYLGAVAKGRPRVTRTRVTHINRCGPAAVLGLSLLSPSPDGSQLFPKPKSPSFLHRVPDPGPSLALGYLSSKKKPSAASETPAAFPDPRSRYRCFLEARMWWLSPTRGPVVTVAL